MDMTVTAQHLPLAGDPLSDFLTDPHPGKSHKKENVRGDFNRHLGDREAKDSLSVSFQSRDTPHPQKRSFFMQTGLYMSASERFLEHFILLLSTSWSLPFAHVQYWSRDSLTGVLITSIFPDYLNRPHRICPCRRSLRRWPWLHTELVFSPAEGSHSPEPPKCRKWIIGTPPAQGGREKIED